MIEMATIKKRETKKGITYHIIEQVNGVRRSKKTSARNLAEARRCLIQFELEKVHSDCNFLTIQKITLNDLWIEYKQYSRLRKTEASQKGIESHVKELLVLWGHKPIDSITTKDIILAQNQWLEEGKAKKTVNNRIILLRAILKYAKEKQFLSRLPETKQLRLDKLPPKFYSQEEINTMLTKFKPFVRDYVVILLNTGMRAGELKRLEWRNVDLKKRTIMVEVAKSHKFRSIPINNNLFDHLQTMLKKARKEQQYVIEAQTLEGKMVNDIYNPFTSEMKKHKLKGNVHMLRHTFASRLVQNGVSIYEVKELLGHADVTTTMIYAHLAPDNMKNAVHKLDFIDSSEAGTKWEPNKVGTKWEPTNNFMKSFENKKPPTSVRD
jgi:integrase